MNATLREVIEAKRPLANLYSYQTVARVDSESIEGAVQDAIQRKPSPYDSHPCPHDRFRWVHALRVSRDATPGDETPVWSLSSDRGAVEERMTGVVRAAVAAQHGIEIAEA